MSNPFSGIITPGMKDLWRQAIEALLEEDGCCAAPCDLIYQGTKFTDCSNCIYDPVGNKSANRYQAGGPNPFPSGSICPVCMGKGKLMEQSTTENVWMAIFWNYKDWKELGLNTPNNRADSLNWSEGKVMTLSPISYYPQLMRCTYAIMDVSSEGYVERKFQRLGEPNPCGLGTSDFITTMWEKIA